MCSMRVIGYQNGRVDLVQRRSVVSMRLARSMQKSQNFIVEISFSDLSEEICLICLGLAHVMQSGEDFCSNIFLDLVE